jgi:hypothetical protein
MASTSSCGEPVMVSEKPMRTLDNFIHAENASSAAHIEDDLVLENMLVLIDRVSV